MSRLTFTESHFTRHRCCRHRLHHNCRYYHHKHHQHHYYYHCHYHYRYRFQTVSSIIIAQVSVENAERVLKASHRLMN